MTTFEFCQRLGVDRKTTWRWRQTPGFGERVRQRRERLFPLARESKCWNQLYLIGVTSLGPNGHGDHRAAVEACKILLGHFSGLTLPARRRPEPRNQTNWVDLFRAAQEQGITD